MEGTITYDVERARKAIIDLGKRGDGRGLLDYRKVKIEQGVIVNAAGSAKADLGGTEVYAGVKFGEGEPFPDSPDEGALIVNAELSGIGAPEFYAGPPDQEAVELSRIVDRSIREGQGIDLKSLCVKKGELVKVLFIDLYIMNHNGNLFDASVLAAVAALKNAKQPVYNKKGELVEGKTEDLKLQYSPVLCTFAKIGDKVLLDPDLNETYGADALFSVAFVESGELVAIQKSLPGTFTSKEISQMLLVAKEKSKELRKL